MRPVRSFFGILGSLLAPLRWTYNCLKELCNSVLRQGVFAMSAMEDFAVAEVGPTLRLSYALKLGLAQAIQALQRARRSRGVEALLVLRSSADWQMELLSLSNCLLRLARASQARDMVSAC